MSDKTKKTKKNKSAKQSKAETTKKNKAAAPQAPQPKPAQDIAKRAVDTDALDDAPMLGTPPSALGTLSAADADTDLGETKQPRAESSPPGKSSMRKQDKSKKSDNDDDRKSNEADGADKQRQEPAQPSVLSAEPPPPDETLDAFRLPRSAFVGLRKSGGLRFTTREVVVYPDGRVAYDARGVPQKEYTRLRRVMNDGQVISLRKLLDQANFWATEGGGEQNPDAYAYDIAARLGQRSNEITVYDGSVPENLKPLIERLSKYLPEE
jgi:hypothetical protein